MKKALLSVSLLVVCLFLYGVIADRGRAQAPGVEASGAALWDYLKKADYRTWKMWPDTEAYHKGQIPHGALLTIYVNDIAFQAIAGKAGSLPDGAIVAMENFSAEKELTAITVMYKVKGYNPPSGDWFWAKYLPGGKIDSEGKVGLCLGCHTMSRGNDYITKHPLK